MLFLKKIYSAILHSDEQLIFPGKRTILAVGALLGALAIIIPFAMLPWLLALGVALVFGLAALVLLVLFIEVWFRLAHKRVYGVPYQFIPNYLDQASFIYEAHPFISYVRRRDFGAAGPPEDSNNFRATFPHGASRDIVTPKPQGLVRISCLGASESAFYEENNGRYESYPTLLENLLQEHYPHIPVEVNNFSTPGHTSAEILVEFLLNSIDTQPDVVVIYHGHNDMRAFLTPGFQADYSHFRRNFSEEYERMRLANLLPFLPLHFYNFLLWQKMPITRNVGDDVHYAVTKGQMNIDAELAGLATFRRNLENIILVCRGRDIQVILSTFCHYFDFANCSDHEKVKWERKVRETILEINGVIRDLAREYDLPLVDNYDLIPQEDRFFKDKIHLSLEGMRLMAQNLAAPIWRYLESRSQATPRKTQSNKPA
jgi:lysophospholipase L1-like esterase